MLGRSSKRAITLTAQNHRQVYGSKNQTSSSVLTSPTSLHHEFHSHSSRESRRPTSEYGSESTFSEVGSFEWLSQDVVARILTHAFREERAFHVCKNLTRSVDPDGIHVARPIDLVRLNPLPGDKTPLIVCIYERPGINHLPRYIDNGPQGRRDGRDVPEGSPG
jgi:hypothetical protein